ncbi:hypothetical protein IEO21_02725 [Rhodonia placenta]|uniref:Uncharacterized protein n=1 Tax=Rhodonia placenta TaxID=104341 RepID=A0A8H7P7J3_9APHY|nr:hypothetical protein IEO21_02725 [Postia placenta]
MAAQPGNYWIRNLDVQTNTDMSDMHDGTLNLDSDAYLHTLLIPPESSSGRLSCR